MAIIDPDGYFGGDRFDDVSDMARAMWPTFYLASNTVARIELNYRKVVALAFSRWAKKPTEVQFWGWIQEYQDAYLLLVYEADGTMWGQWDTSEKFLQRHKLAADLRTPAPPSEQFEEWKNEYLSKKLAKSNPATNFKIFRKSAQDFAGSHTNVRGVGVGVGGGIGVGGGENKPTATPAVFVPTPAQWFDLTFWPAWPVKENKEQALSAAKKIPASDRGVVMAGLLAQADYIRSQERPIHASTWLNQKRWTDEPRQPRQSGSLFPDRNETRRIETIAMTTMLRGLNQ